MSFKLLSHPDKLLKDHLFKVREIGLSNFDRHSIFNEYRELLEIVLLFHDLGKASHYFQDYLNPTKENPNEKFKKHSEISAQWAYIYCHNILKYDLKKSLFVYLLIRKHHGSLNNFDDNFTYDLDEEDLLKISSAIDYNELRLIYKDLKHVEILSHKNFVENVNISFGNKKLRSIKTDLSISDYYVLNYLFSLLISADKADTIFKSMNYNQNHIWSNNLVKKYKRSLSSNNSCLNKIRELSFSEAEENIDNSSIFSLNIPTGSGKTINSLNIALKLKEQFQLERLIYCLPFTSVIDQNYDVFNSILESNNICPTSDILLKHHHLSELNYTTNNESYSLQEASYLVETWDSELVVTTFFQFLHTLFSNKNSSLKKFHNFANSVIILDEVQAIPHKYWNLIKTMLIELTGLFNIKIILVTATMPLIFAETEVKELVVNKKSYFSQMNRIELNLEMLKTKLPISDFIEVLCEKIEIHKDKSHLIICNTIKSAYDIYAKLKEIYDDKVLYLSTHLLPLHRLEKIKSIKDNPLNKIIVSTQLVEAGVDIDIDFVYRDFAPLDSIFQACGRCNRNDSKSKSMVYLFELINDKEKTFHSLIYDCVLTEHTKKCFKGFDSIEEKDFLMLANIYYQELNNITSQDVSQELLDYISKLQYDSAFSYSNNNDAFRLIDSYKTVTAFIEYDQNAKDIYQELLDTIKNNNLDIYEKRIILKNIFRKMSPYILNLPERYAEVKDGVFYINNESMKVYYSKESGFKTTSSNEDFIL